MRKVIAFMHVSLDGFVAGPEGQMDWIDTPAELFEFIGARVNQTDTALYGRTTYEMMEGYWPTAGEQPGASEHDREHSQWYNRVSKVVLSKTLPGDLPGIRVIGGTLAEELNQLKREEGSEILLFGSPTAAHALMAEDLIDGYWLFVNPVVLGRGIPLFEGVRDTARLRLLDSKVFPSGVVCLNYERST